MTVRATAVIAALWVLSLLVTARWTAQAQSSQVGQDVRFIRSQSRGSVHRGILVANFNGQWLPVELDAMPDGNQLQPRGEERRQVP